VDSLVLEAVVTVEATVEEEDELEEGEWRREGR